MPSGQDFDMPESEPEPRLSLPGAPLTEQLTPPTPQSKFQASREDADQKPQPNFVVQPKTNGNRSNRNKRKNRNRNQKQNQKQKQKQKQNREANADGQSHHSPARLNSVGGSGHASTSSLSSTFRFLTPTSVVHTPSSNSQPTATANSSRSAPTRITEEDRIRQIVLTAVKQAKANLQRLADDAAMAARANRPRPGPSREDPAAAQEETSMWNQIVADLKICKGIKEKASELVNQVIELERIMGKSPTSAQETELDAMYREIVRLTEDEKRILHEEPHDVIKNLGILRALRAASEIEPRNAPTTKSRNQKNKPPKPEMDGAADSPGPSPSMATSATKLKGSSVRSGSVPSIKDPKEISIKIEEGSEGSKGPVAERMGKFIVGAEVAYKQAKMKDDGSQWIQCNIIDITEVGTKKRYAVQDPEPDEGGALGQIYKTSANNMIAIPTPDTFLADYPVGKHVLARYPETTTFYRAEVTAIKKDIYQLKFEDDQNQEMEVARRYVLDLGSRL